MMKFLHNVGDYFSSNYFNDEFVKEVVKKTGYTQEDLKVKQKQISSLKEKYFRYKETVLEGRLRIKDKVTETHKFHRKVLNALGYDGDHTNYSELFPVDDKTVLPVRNTLYRDTQPHLMIMEMHTLIKEGDEEPDGLFEQQYHIDDEETTQTPPQRYHRSQWANVFKVPEGVQISPMVINKAISRLFLLDSHRRPKYILLCAGNIYYLLEQEKWFRGSYLEFDLEALFDEASIKRNYYSLFYTLLAKETLAPQSEIVLMDQLDEESHKKAYEVTQDLKEGVIHAVETIANEAVNYLRDQGEVLKNINADALKNECLTYVYRLLFLFYAESRQDLDILPADDPIYQHGYSLEMLRDLEQTPLNTASSRDGFFFHDSLSKLFALLSSGYREKDGSNRSFKIRHLDSPLFNDAALEILPKAKLRNIIWQDIICQLSLSKKQKGKSRGRISYANLGINQLGSVYESLLAFRGFFAETDYIEVHRKLKAKEKSESVANKDGSYLVPRHRIDDFDPKEVFRDKDDVPKIIDKGTFIYRLSGRDRQKSASYYTPEVLTQCTVKYTLKPILEKLEKGEIEALDLLKLKVLEPAMGAAAFHNEVINQLAEAYLQYRQQELKGLSALNLKTMGLQSWRVEPDKYQEELQKVKAYIALHNVYGVDLNPTAVELGKLSLWLNVIHKDMQTPFFGYRLGTGNAVVGSWLKVYKEKDFSEEFPTQGTARQLATPIRKLWWTKAPKHLTFKKAGINRKENEVYHFLLPDGGMVPSATIKLLKTEYGEECLEVRDWRKAFTAPLHYTEIDAVKEISRRIDILLEEHYENQKKMAEQTEVAVSVFGALDILEEQSQIEFEASRSYQEKEAIANQRTNHNAPYFKLKMIMDYWCSLWFWDVRDASELPTRSEWYDDLMYILEYEMTGSETVEELKNYRRKEQSESAVSELANNAQSGTLFENNRLKLVKQYAEMYRFFHYQLEFVEVFRERGGFDLIVGNPPWITVSLSKVGFWGDVDPLIAVKGYASSKIDSLVPGMLSNNATVLDDYIQEISGVEGVKSFSKGDVNFPLNNSSKSNLHKLVLENSLQLGRHIGMVVDRGIFDDPNGGELRNKLYHRLDFLFRFINEKILFDIGHAKKFEVLVMSEVKETICFNAISNVYHPVTIESSLRNDDSHSFGIKNEQNDWELRGNRARVIQVNNKLLQLINSIFNEDPKGAKKSTLPIIHSQVIENVLGKFGALENKLRTFVDEVDGTQMLNETNSQKNGLIKKSVGFVDPEAFVISGPHFYVANPLAKTPNENCSSKGDYSKIELSNIQNEFLPRTVFIQTEKCKVSNDIENYYHIHRRRAVSTNERTLIGCIVPPHFVHTNGGFSLHFEDEIKMVVFSAIASSIISDFLVRISGKEDILFKAVDMLPVNTKLSPRIINRYLRLNCLTNFYADLWNKLYTSLICNDDLFDTKGITKHQADIKEWDFDTPYRTDYDRRLASIEIDVLYAMELGLTLNDLLEVYRIQFPVLANNDSNIAFDSNGAECGDGAIVVDRVEDYQTAWAHFEQVFGEGSNE